MTHRPPPRAEVARLDLPSVILDGIDDEMANLARRAPTLVEIDAAPPVAPRRGALARVARHVAATALVVAAASATFVAMPVPGAAHRRVTSAVAGAGTAAASWLGVLRAVATR